jgi:hypothetical protein
MLAGFVRGSSFMPGLSPTTGQTARESGRAYV